MHLHRQRFLEHVVGELPLVIHITFMFILSTEVVHVVLTIGGEIHIHGIVQYRGHIVLLGVFIQLIINLHLIQQNTACTLSPQKHM